MNKWRLYTSLTSNPAGEYVAKFDEACAAARRANQEALEFEAKCEDIVRQAKLKLAPADFTPFKKSAEDHFPHEVDEWLDDEEEWAADYE